MNYKITMEQMRDQLMHTLKQDGGYKIIDLLTDEIINSKADKEIKKELTLSVDK